MRFGLRECLFLIVLLSVPVAAWWFVFKPRNAQILQATAEITVKQGQLDRLAEATAKIDDMSAAIEEGHDAIELVERKLPNEQGVDAVLREAWKLAHDHQLQIRSVTPKKKLPTAQYMELPITWEVEGNFDGFYEFLLALEQIPRLTQIRELNMLRDQEHEGDLEASFILSIYFQPHDDSAGSVAGVTP